MRGDREAELNRGKAMMNEGKDSDKGACLGPKLGVIGFGRLEWVMVWCVDRRLMG